MENINNKIPVRDQLNVIWLSKVFNDSELMQRTGINDLNVINYILENENDIIERWRSSKNKKSDDTGGIDALILKWITRCKTNNIKLPISVANKKISQLTQLLEIPYHISHPIWTKMRKVVYRRPHWKHGKLAENAVIPNLCNILKTEGIRLLKPHIYRKFLATMEKNLSLQQTCGSTNHGFKANDDNENVTIIEDPDDCINISNGDIETSYTQHEEISIIRSTLSSTTVKLNNDNKKEPFPNGDQSLEFITEEIDEESLEIKTEIVDDFVEEEEHFGIYKLEQTLNGVVTNLDIKQEEEFIEDNGTICQQSSTHTEINQQIETDAENINDILLNEIKIEETKIQLNCDKQLEVPLIGKTPNNPNVNALIKTAAKQTDDEKVQVVYEVEDSDEDEQHELQINNKYNNTNPENSAQNKKLLTILETICNDKDKSERDLMQQKQITGKPQLQVQSESNFTKAEDLKHKKRTASYAAADNNMPSTSRPNKVSRLDSDVLNNIISGKIKSNSNAIKSLQHLRNYFESKCDRLADHHLYRL